MNYKINIEHSALLPPANLAKDATLFRYDLFNRLVEVHEPELIAKYTYDGNGLRVQKSVNGATSRQIWDGSQIALERAPTGLRLYYYGLGRYASRDEAGRTAFYIYNTHNDVVKLVGSVGNVIHEYDCDAPAVSTFGVERNIDVADANPWRYCGEYWDGETGSIYLRARYYSPGMGRFGQEDEIGYSRVADPISFNLFVYCANNPVLYFDPFGHDYDTLRSFVKDMELIYGKKTVFEFGKDSHGEYTIVKMGDKELNAQGKFYFNGDVKTGENEYKNIAENINGSLKMEREDFLDEMSIPYSVETREFIVSKIQKLAQSAVVTTVVTVGTQGANIPTQVMVSLAGGVMLDAATLAAGRYKSKITLISVPGPKAGSLHFTVQELFLHGIDSRGNDIWSKVYDQPHKLFNLSAY